MFCPWCLLSEVNLEHLALWCSYVACRNLCYVTLMFEREVISLFVCWFVGLSLAQQLPQWARASSFTRFLDHTQRRTTVGRTPLDEWSTRRRDLYLTTHDTHNKNKSILPVGFEPRISAGERPQMCALYCAATGTGQCLCGVCIYL
jgi:hypothetical protein